MQDEHCSGVSKAGRHCLSAGWHAHPAHSWLLLSRVPLGMLQVWREAAEEGGLVCPVIAVQSCMQSTSIDFERAVLVSPLASLGVPKRKAQDLQKAQHAAEDLSRAPFARQHPLDYSTSSPSLNLRNNPESPERLATKKIRCNC